METPKPRISDTTAGLMIGVALFYVALQWLLAFVWMGWMAALFAYLTFYIWFKTHDVGFLERFGAKKVIAWVIAPLASFFSLGVLPGIIVSVIMTIAIVKLEDKLIEKGIVSREDLKKLESIVLKKGRMHGFDSPEFNKELARSLGRDIKERYTSKLPQRSFSTAQYRPDYKPAMRMPKEIRPTPRTHAPIPPAYKSEGFSPRETDILPIGQPLDVTPSGVIPEQDIDWNQIAFVRADSYAPKVESGSVLIQNAYDATGGEVKRLTNHFSLNHRVSANIGGNWENSPYLYIVPGKAMVADNGIPDNLYSVDSFWSKSVKLPAGSVIIHERGRKPNLGPNEHKFTFVEKAPNQSDTKVLSDVLKKMGYTEISGSNRYSDTAGFDDVLQKFTEKKGLRFGLHEFSWSEAWEQAQAFLQDKDYVQALGTFLQLTKDQSESKRMPLNIKGDLLNDIYHSFESNPGNENKKLFIKPFIGILEGEPTSDNKLLVESAPISLWKYAYHSMLENIGEGIDDYKNKADVDAAFEELYAEPYEKLVGRPLDIGEKE